MDEVKLDGKIYKRSAAVAKKFGYTSDYMGQLSRSGRIDAQMVGRSWYVYPPSVEEYQASLEEEDTSASKTSKASPKTDTQTKKAEPSKKPSPIKKAAQIKKTSTKLLLKIRTDNRRYTVKTHPGEETQSISDKRARPDEVISARRDDSPDTETANNATSSRRDSYILQAQKTKDKNRNWQSAVYHKDDTELHPVLSKQNPAEEKSTPKEPSRQLRVHGSTDKYTIITPSVPSVPLRGKLSLTPEDDDEVDLGFVEKRLKTLSAKPAPQKQPLPTKRVPTSKPSVRQAPVEDMPLDTPKKDVVSFAPASIVEVQVTQTRMWLWWLLVMTLIALLIFMLLFGEFVVSYEAADGAQSERWRLVWPDDFPWW